MIMMQARVVNVRVTHRAVRDALLKHEQPAMRELALADLQFLHRRCLHAQITATK